MSLLLAILPLKSHSVEMNNYFNTLFWIPLLQHTFFFLSKGYQQDLYILKISLKSIFSWIQFLPRNANTLVISFSEE